MYAVIETGGKQYRVELGSELAIERLDAEAGETISFERVLLVADGDDAQIGTPTVGDAVVTADVVSHDRGDKVIVFKYRPKARHRAKKGHRQAQTIVRVADIQLNGRSAAAEAGKQAEAEQKARKAEAAEAARKAAADKAIAARLAEQAKAEQEAEADDEAKTKAAKPSRSATAKKPAKTDAGAKKKATATAEKESADSEPEAEPAEEAEASSDKSNKQAGTQRATARRAAPKKDE